MTRRTTTGWPALLALLPLLLAPGPAHGQQPAAALPVAPPTAAPAPLASPPPTAPAPATVVPASAPPAAAPTAAAAAATAGWRQQLVGQLLRSTGPDGVASEQPLPCPAQALAELGGRLYLACGAEGLAVLALDDPSHPRLLERRLLEAPVSGLHLAAGQLWIETTHTEARPLAGVAVAAPPAASGSASSPVAAAPLAAPSAAALPAGRVVESRSGQVVIDFGTDQGLRRRDHVALYLVHAVDLGETSTSEEEELLAVGEVTALSATRAQVQLGLNERVPTGAAARRTPAGLTENRFLPPRVDGVWEASFVARPFLAVGSYGFGTVSEAQLGLRLPERLHLQLQLDPIGLGFADEGNIIALAGNAVAAYDTHLFEIGLGLGWSAVNDRLDGSSAADEGGGTGPGAIDTDLEKVKSGPSIVQVARLGSVDGLHLTVRNAFLLYEDAFHYGGTVAEFQLPVSRRSWLLGRGGAGAAGYGYGEVGLRWLARGNGDRGSLFVTVTAGGAALSGQEDKTYTYADQNGDEVTYTSEETFSYGGPLVGFGMEWRL